MGTAKEQYDELWSGAWGDMQTFGPVHRHALERIVATVAKLGVRTILDVGCGSGQNLRALSASGPYGLTGVDVSEKALARARTAVPDAELHCLDVQSQKLEAQFDLVMSLQVVE